jgi:hypothetical protein
MTAEAIAKALGGPLSREPGATSLGDHLRTGQPASVDDTGAWATVDEAGGNESTPSSASPLGQADDAIRAAKAEIERTAQKVAAMAAKAG